MRKLSRTLFLLFVIVTAVRESLSLSLFLTQDPPPPLSLSLSLPIRTNRPSRYVRNEDGQAIRVMVVRWSVPKIFCADDTKAQI